jgi:microcystin-dependent protein
MPSLKHKFTSLKADGGDATFVKPSDWNDEHDLVADGASMYLGRDATGSGNVQEIPVQGTGGGDSGTIYTKAAVDAAIAAAVAAAVAGITPFATGDIMPSVSPSASKAGGWVLCNGQGLFLGNGESNHALFLLLWAQTVPVSVSADGKWPVSPSRGLTAEADWLASKTVNVPDLRGTVLSMLDHAAGVNSLVAYYGIRVGAEKVPLTIPNLPAHDHTIPVMLPNLGGVGSGNSWWDGATTRNTGMTGGDPAAAPPFSAPVPVSVVQPTAGVNFFIKL